MMSLVRVEMSSRMEVYMEVYGSSRNFGAMASDWVIRYNLDFNFQPAYECFQK